MKRKLLLFIFLLSTTFFAHNELKVNDPQSWWSWDEGTIEEATISIKPMGTYIEYGLYLTFSAKNTSLTSVEQLEVVLDFDLPKEAIISDLWLWVGDDIMKGIMMDKWKASQIYEDIVNRRKDPALLLKNSPTQYQLRIYPMKGDSTRKIKLTYAVPISWGLENVTSALPINILNTSKKRLEKLKLLFNSSDEWKNPKIIEYPEIKFQNAASDDFKNYLVAELPLKDDQNILNFSLDNPMVNGVYLSAHRNSNQQGVYQLAFLPKTALNLNSNKKILFLFDYDATKTNISKSDIINSIKSKIHNHFTVSDSINLLFSNLSLNTISANWESADSISIENLFKAAGSNPLSDYSNLPALLNKGIQYLAENGNNGSIFLISSSDQVGDYKLANPLMDDLISQMNPICPVHIVDVNNKNYNYYYFGGRNYTGNEYFYQNISRKSNGKFERIAYNKTYENALANIFESLTGFVSSFDMITNIQNGFCYSRYNLSNSSGTIYLDQPIVQIGKFSGDFPFEVQSAGFYDSEPFVSNFTIDESNIFRLDSCSEKIWAGKYIQSLEGEGANYWYEYSQSNDIISEIVDLSLEHNILSRYTALLALEPSDTVKPCLDCFDETGDQTSIEDVEGTDELSYINAYPNPFNMETRIKINLGKNHNPGDFVSMKIYNINGQEVKTFDYEEFAGRTKFELVWDGANNDGQIVSSGIYIFVLQTPNEKLSFKLILIK